MAVRRLPVVLGAERALLSAAARCVMHHTARMSAKATKGMLENASWAPFGLAPRPPISLACVGHARQPPSLACQCCSVTSPRLTGCRSADFTYANDGDGKRVFYLGRELDRLAAMCPDGEMRRVHLQEVPQLSPAALYCG